MYGEKFVPIIQELMGAKNQALVLGNLDQLMAFYTGDISSWKSFIKTKQLLEARLRAAKERKINYRGQVTSISVNPVVRTGNLVKIDLTEIVTWWFEDHGRLRFECGQYDHQMVLEHRGKWLIKEDYFRWEPDITTIPSPLSLRGSNDRAVIKSDSNFYRRNRYDRIAAVRYAHRWWNSYNPNFRAFSVDCTNFVSQVMFAGGIPIMFTGKQNTGWWYRGNGGENDQWSYSWSVAHSLRWYLASGKSLTQVELVSKPEKLLPGDIICYDWDGDDVWQHNTVVVGFSVTGQPLVNAHTGNSQNRYWDYRDSPAWSKETKYLFWHILN